MEIAASFHIAVSDRASPHLDRIRGHAVFGRGLLVFAIEGFVQAVCPGMPVVPVEHPAHREKRVLRRGICNVANKRIHVVSVASQPAGIEVSDHGGGVDEVPVVKVVVVIICSAEISA